MPHAITDPLLYSLDLAAAKLGICRATVYKLMDSGQLRNVKIGGRRMIHVDALREFAARGTKPATS